MTSRTDKLLQTPPDWELWQKLYYNHHKAYLRQRLLAIKYLWEEKIVFFDEFAVYDRPSLFIGILLTGRE